MKSGDIGCLEYEYIHIVTMYDINLGPSLESVAWPGPLPHRVFIACKCLYSYWQLFRPSGVWVECPVQKSIYPQNYLEQMFEFSGSTTLSDMSEQT